MNPQRRMDLYLCAAVTIALVAFFAVISSAKAASPLRATVAQLATTVTYNCPDSPEQLSAKLGRGVAAYAQDMPDGTPDNVCIPGKQEPGTFDHEMGHVFDYQHMDAFERGQFVGIMDLGRAWRDGGPNPPSEKFAEAFRMCATNTRRPDRWVEGYGYHPSKWQHRAVCRLIERAT